MAPFRPAGPYRVDDWTPLRLAPEDPTLLAGYLGAGMPPRRPCRILAASVEQERQARAAALADALAFEAAVAENLLILHPDDVDAAGYLGVMRAALPVVDGRPILPLAVTR